MKSTTLSYVGHNKNNDRFENDFYATPLDAIEDLIKYEKFDGKILECSCGDGAISDPLIKAGYDVYSSDLIDRGYGETGVDFLKSTKQVDNIITNPPFNLATEFTLHGLNLINKKMALLCKLSFLEGKKRASVLFNQNKLKKVLIFSRRLGFKKNDKKGGLMAFAWFIYDVNYNGKPTIDWI
mgnify:CR=1 FL=1|tara:strand:- start:13 stop:558 length:546 start_codon:yes stop_codon:yes gene_type:complete